MYPKVWLIGAGKMALEYAKVFKAQKVDFLTIGRGEESAESFERHVNTRVIRGGIGDYLKEHPKVPDYAIICVGVEQLKNATVQLLSHGVKEILVEKPGGINKQEIQEVNDLSEVKKVHVYIAYNRRFYASVERAEEIIAAEGGAASFNFEFTEWSHEIEKLVKAPGVKERWFLANSTHVVDMAFYLGGIPEKLSCYNAGSLPWHPSSSVFAGAGISETGALFSYQANWEGPGRWGVEVCTRMSRLIFRPLEKLQIQKKGSVNIEMVDINDELDREFKPGLYKQVETFFDNRKNRLCSIKEQLKIVDTYNKMANY